MPHPEARERLILTRDARYPRKGCQTHLVILAKHMVGKASLSLNGICIIEAGNKQYLPDHEWHKVMKDISLSIMPVEELLQQFAA